MKTKSIVISLSLILAFYVINTGYGLWSHELTIEIANNIGRIDPPDPPNPPVKNTKAITVPSAIVSEPDTSTLGIGITEQYSAINSEAPIELLKREAQGSLISKDIIPVASSIDNNISQINENGEIDGDEDTELSTKQDRIEEQSDSNQANQSIDESSKVERDVENNGEETRDSNNDEQDEINNVDRTTEAITNTEDEEKSDANETQSKNEETGDEVNNTKSEDIDSRGNNSTNSSSEENSESDIDTEDNTDNDPGKPEEDNSKETNSTVSEEETDS